MFPVSTLHACALILVPICRRSACDIAVGTACDTSPTYEDIILPAVKTDMASVAGNFCSHIGTVSQAAPAAM